MIIRYPARAVYGEDEIRMAVEQKKISMCFITERVETGPLGELGKTYRAAGGVVEVARPGNRCYEEINKWSGVAFCHHTIVMPGEEEPDDNHRRRRRDRSRSPRR